MKTELDILYTWLLNKYQHELKLQMVTEPSGTEEVVWVTDNSGQSQVAELLDRQTGIWIKFRCIGKETIAINLRQYVEQDVQWGLNKMASLARRSGINKSDVDENGGWQIHLIWLVDEKHQDTWCNEMQSLRSQSGYSEELGLDAVFYFSEKLEKALDVHKLPQLLIATRKLLGLKSADIETWTSANVNFSNELIKLPLQFGNPLEQELAQNYVNTVMSQHSSGHQVQPLELTIPKKPNQLKITGLRNIKEAEISLSSEDDKVNVKVIHGPNGTGKSSIFEALSLGVSGVSIGLAEYLKDDQKDLTPTERSQYVTRVLQAFNSDSPPTITIDGQNGLQNVAKSAEDARAARSNADGTLLAQEDARDFVQKSGSDLGARILSGYSTLAQIAQTQVDNEYQNANQLRKDWLSEFDLSSAITKPETRLQKLVLHFIEAQLPRATQQIGDWLTTLSHIVPELAECAQTLASKWMRIDSLAEREDISSRIANTERLGFGADILASWIEARHQIILSINELIAKNRSGLEKLAANLPEIQQDIELWSTWLVARKNMEQKVQSGTENLQKDDQQIVFLNKELVNLTETGRQLRIQFDHLEAISRDPLPRWAEIHPDICPTCNTKHERGIASVVDQLKFDLNKKIIELRETYAEKQQSLKLLRNQQASTGQCPISHERQTQLATWTYLPEEGQESLGASLLQPDFAQRHIASLQRLITIPALSDLEKNSLPIVDVARRVIDVVSKQNAIGEALWVLPDRWKTIKKSVDEVALRIVTEHLPSTLETVWLELVFFLTPARWNIAGNPSLKPDIVRGTQKLRVIIQPNGIAKNSEKILLARYAFNQAEQHILGMAWFFTRYLTHGRFRHALIALDDPAQEMDQTTYRAFVRWLQVFSRLHNVRKIPLSLVAFLHQEDRALDLARATSQKITMLQWARTLQTSGQNATVQDLILRNEEQKPSLPTIFRMPKLVSVVAE